MVVRFPYQAPSEGVNLRNGSVTGVNPSGTVSVLLDGSTVANVPTLADVEPGEAVVVAATRYSLLVLGTLGNHSIPGREWHYLALLSGFDVPQGYLAPAVALLPSGEWVFRGRITPASGTFSANTAYHWGDMPPGWPALTAQVVRGGLGTAGGSHAARMWIEPNGWLNCATSGASTALDLNGLIVTPY